MEKFPSSSDPATFSEIATKLERVLKDPVVEQFLAEFDAIEDKLNSSDESPSNFDSRILELNRMWPYQNIKVRLNGAISVINGPGLPEKSLVRDELVKSHGFKRLTSRGPEGEPETRICYAFTCYSGNGETQFGYAPIKEVEVEYPFNSPELAGNYLEYFDNELKTEVDNLLQSYDGPLATDVMALKDFSLIANPGDYGCSEKIAKITEYVNAKIDLDDQPYFIDIGTKFLHKLGRSDDSYVIEHPGGKYMATVKYLKLDSLKADPDSVSIEHKPVLEVEIHTDNHRAVSEQCIVPLESVQDLRPVRSLLANINTDSESSQND